MKQKNIIMIGAGKRVIADTLPALENLDQLSVKKIFAKHPKKIHVNDTQRQVEDLKSLTEQDLKDADLIYLAVTKQSVPSVLKKLVAYDLSHMDLMVETPVLLFKHLHHVNLMDGFKGVWVAEDCITLPCFDPLRDLAPMRHALLDRSAYRYHSLALLKTLLGTTRILSAKVSGKTKRTIRFEDNKTGVVIEPRDYQKGRFHLENRDGAFSDHTTGEPIKRLTRDGLITGFQIQDILTPLNPAESALLGPQDPDATLTSMMDSLKRVGLYRLMRRFQEGEEGYPLMEGLEDMAIDYYLEKLGFYWNSPLMSLKSGMGRFLIKSLMKVLPG